jgi:Rieske Fe-S protein
MDSSISRRTLLAAGAAGAGAVTLAACSSGSGNGGSGGSSAQPAGSKLVALADVPVGGAAAVKLPDGTPGVVARPTSTEARCFSAICTHQGCTVAVHGKELDCPCHGSRFNALTGAVISGLAPRALDKIPVTVKDGEVVTS